MSDNAVEDKSADYTIAVDAMGGDYAPEIVLHGLELAAEKHPDIKVLLVGDENILQKLLTDKYKKASRICTVRHASENISMDMKPTLALRMKDSSMRRAIEAVANGEAEAVVSAGNSGALLAISKIVIKTLPGISRPALAAVQPSLNGDIVMLDLGANISCDSKNLVDFSIMGEALAQVELGIKKPTIGLLNVGSEESKGSEELKDASEKLKQSSLSDNYKGFVEGHDITKGTTNVVITDGFTGNVSLKTGEGALNLAFSFLKEIFTKNLLTRLGYLLVKPEINKMREWLNPSKYNGAIFVGLNGVVVKSHGGADSQGYASAINVAIEAVDNQLNEKIRLRLEQLSQ